MKIEIGDLFLREHALRHVVQLIYKVELAAKIDDDYASCFVVEIRGFWFLVSAGHVVLGMRRLRDNGATFSSFQLVDSAAGANQPTYPIDMDVDAWLAVDDPESGLDVAAMVLNDLTVDALRAGNVKAIELTAVRPAEFLDKHQLVLVGAAAERFRLWKGGGQMRMTLIPVVQASPSDDMPERGSSVLGQIVGDPADRSDRVNDVKGMSGCPVFMVEQEGDAMGQLHYWVVGIQSSWDSSSRIVRISQLQPLVDVLEAHIDSDVSD